MLRQRYGYGLISFLVRLGVACTLTRHPGVWRRVLTRAEKQKKMSIVN